MYAAAGSVLALLVLAADWLITSALSKPNGWVPPLGTAFLPVAIVPAFAAHGVYLLRQHPWRTASSLGCLDREPYPLTL